MKNQATRIILAFAALLALQTGCNSNEQKTSTVNQETPTPKARPGDTLKIYLLVRKMEMQASTMAQSGVYDSALGRFNKCIAVLNNALSENNNTGISLFGGEIIEINESEETIYDSLKDPESAMKCVLQCLKWAKITDTYSLQITSDMNMATRLKNVALSAAGDTAKKESCFRQAIQYAFAGIRVIDSLKTNDMDDLKYRDFHVTSTIFAAWGDKKQARAYDKKYKEVYFKIYNKQPEEN